MPCDQNLIRCPICEKSLILSDLGKAYSCENNHYFDIAKQGYVNLLTSNQKKSKLPGDSRQMVEARRRFLQKGYYEKISDQLNTSIIGLFQKNRDDCFNILDLGCGEGYYSNRLIAAVGGIHYYGIDISKEAVKCASSANKRGTFLVGTSYRLPFPNESFHCLLSVFSPVKDTECARVLKQMGSFIRILPGSRHLIEIRDIIYPRTILSEESDTAESFLGLQHMSTHKIDFQINLNQEELFELVKMTPHYWKTTQTDKNALKGFSALDVTVSMRLVVYQK